MSDSSVRLDVWVVEDNDLLRETIFEVIQATSHLECTLATNLCDEAIRAAEQDGLPAVVLMDIGLPDRSGLEGISRIKEASPSTKIVVLTVYEDDDKIFAAICAGASGYLLKPSSPRAVLAAIESVLRGEAPMSAQVASRVLKMFATFGRQNTQYGLTKREREILKEIVNGLTCRQIAEKLFLSRHTVDTHLRNIYDKLHVRNRSGAVATAIRNGLIGPR
jgi:DNA-binding NarL/FixJ family response regulator